MRWLRERVIDGFWLYFRLALHAFYRRIDVEGAEHVPPQAPLLIVSNHVNAFVDPLVIQLALPHRRRLTITAKGPLLERPILGSLMRLGNVVAFHRQQDLGAAADLRRTLDNLEDIRRRLAAGAAVSLFPEAKSHEDAHMRPWKHGAARLALDAVRRGEAPYLLVLPVGLNFEAKEHLRSRVLVRFGTPVDVAEWSTAHPGADHEALTAELCDRVRGLIVECDTKRDRTVIGWAARLSTALSGTDGYPAEVREAARLRDRLKREGRGLRTRLRRIRSSLGGLDPAALVRPPPPKGMLVALAPVAAWGALNHALPWAIVRAITRRLSRLPDLWAPNAVFSSLVVFPLLLALQTSCVGLLAGPLWALAYALSLLPSGAAALLWWDRLRDVGAWEAARGARARRDVVDALAEARQFLGPVRDAAETKVKS